LLSKSRGSVLLADVCDELGVSERTARRYKKALDEYFRDKLGYSPEESFTLIEIIRHDAGERWALRLHEEERPDSFQRVLSVYVAMLLLKSFESTVLQEGLHELWRHAAGTLKPADKNMLANFDRKFRCTGFGLHPQEFLPLLRILSCRADLVVPPCDKTVRSGHRDNRQTGLIKRLPQLRGGEHMAMVRGAVPVAGGQVAGICYFSIDTRRQSQDAIEVSVHGAPERHHAHEDVATAPADAATLLQSVRGLLEDVTQGPSVADHCVKRVGFQAGHRANIQLQAVLDGILEAQIPCVLAMKTQLHLGDVCDHHVTIHFGENPGEPAWSCPGIENPWNATDITEIQLIITELGTSGSEYNCVTWKLFRNVSEILSTGLTAIATTHNNEAFQCP